MVVVVVIRKGVKPLVVVVVVLIRKGVKPLVVVVVVIRKGVKPVDRR